MHHFNVYIDTETSDRAGAGGMFQVESVFDENGNEVTDTLGIDVGHHYSDQAELAADIATKLQVEAHQVTLNLD